LQYRQLVAVAFMLGLFMDILDTTIVNVALPTLAREFDVATSGIEWVVTAYLLSLALWIPASGWIGDRFGTKRTFMTALALFTLGSVLCGCSWSLGSLVAFRVVQGVGGGMLTPVGTAMLYRAYPPEDRARASSILSSVTVLAPALGPVLGGFLVDKVNWRWIFGVNVPFGIIGLIFTGLFLEEHREESAGGFDRHGFALAGVGLAALLFGLSEGPSHGWGSTVVLLSLAGGVAALVLLVVVEHRSAEPMLDLDLLRDRSFRTPMVVSFAASGALLGMLFILPQFLQGPRGLSPLQSGLTTFPQALGLMSTARLVGARLYHVVGPRRLVAVGLTANAVITALFLFVDSGTSQWEIRGFMYARGLMMGLVFIPLQAAAFARISLADTGRASALYQTQRQVGSAVGVALVATILASRLRALVPASMDLTRAAVDPSTAGAYTTAFHTAVIGSVVLCAVGAAVGLLLRDSDAAPTMRRLGRAAREPVLEH
jgi:EmrB/QacA subfamily drug resistance transporter